MFQVCLRSRRLRSSSFLTYLSCFSVVCYSSAVSPPLHLDMAIRLTAKAVLLLLLMILFVALYAIVEITGANSPLSVVAGISPDDEVSYGIIIDAGSTGSRLFLYNWRATSSDELIDIKPTLDEHNNPVVRKVFPGLSTFADKPNHAADYIKPLLDYAIEYVPPANRPYTPVFILATAGMRLVPTDQQKAILTDLHTRLPKLTEMQIMKEHIRVIEGKWEGIYSWIAVNYILGKFTSSHSNPPQTSSTISDVSTATTVTPQRQPAVGMIDMGGASVQIAFEMPANETFRSENVENINLGCKDDDPTFKYQLYVTTFLGYGVNEGLRRYEQSLSDSLDNGTLARDPCLPVNLQKEVVRADGTKFMRKGTGDWQECTAQLTSLVTKTDEKSKCADSCFFGSAPAPKMSLNDVEIYGFSEYWFSVEDVLGLGGAYNYTQVAEKSHGFCSQRWSSIQNQARRKLYTKANDDRLRSQCFKSAWVNSVLHGGFNVSKYHNTFRSAYNIAGQEIQWALGAMIYNMRYYPLRLAQRKKLQEEAAHFHKPVSSIQITQLFAIVVLIGAVAYVTYLCTTRKPTPTLRRENSFWSYMMVPSTDDRYKTTSNIYRSPLTPSLS
ncbi:hypothetical protein PFISCL1PPCAC_26862 [Pristionchus fissidentatus]|uniref:Nucleoside phosphatase n=1 Tax=Pristionchus fissidentatus TaxID=1538716 RepID=A0AAV5WY44_9BILA|nr:hypothetical protein PFISCL1PPCAC_26862 [Pristionchus fissidentatus]